MINEWSIMYQQWWLIKQYTGWSIDNYDQPNSIDDGLTLMKQNKNNSITKCQQSIKSI